MYIYMYDLGNTVRAISCICNDIYVLYCMCIVYSIHVHLYTSSIEICIYCSNNLINRYVLQ